MPPARKKSKGLHALVEEDDAGVLPHDVPVTVNAPLEVNSSGDVIGSTTPALVRGRAKGVAQWSETERVVRRRSLNAQMQRTISRSSSCISRRRQLALASPPASGTALLTQLIAPG